MNEDQRKYEIVLPPEIMAVDRWNDNNVHMRILGV